MLGRVIDMNNDRMEGNLEPFTLGWVILGLFMSLSMTCSSCMVELTVDALEMPFMFTV